MKRKLFIIVLAVTFMLSGCGEKEKVITRDNKDNNSNSQAQTESNNADSKTSEQGYVFVSGDAEIEIEAEAKAYLDVLGEPQSYYEAASCAFGDLDKVYTYNGFELDTFSQDGKDYVSSVVLLDDSVSTKEGVCIGDSVDRVNEVYGECTSKTDNAMVYAKGNMKLCFFVEDNAVVSVQYLNTILD